MNDIQMVFTDTGGLTNPSFLEHVKFSLAKAPHGQSREVVGGHDPAEKKSSLPSDLPFG